MQHGQIEREYFGHDLWSLHQSHSDVRSIADPEVDELPQDTDLPELVRFVASEEYSFWNVAIAFLTFRKERSV